MADLENPHLAAQYLRDASKVLSYAHGAAGEREGDRTNLIGPVRDVIFGLNSAVDALAALIEEGIGGHASGDGLVWETCAVCNVPIFRHQAWVWSHQGGTPPTDHDARPGERDG